jgi:hypothetical protein
MRFAILQVVAIHDKNKFFIGFDGEQQRLALWLSHDFPFDFFVAPRQIKRTDSQQKAASNSKILLCHECQNYLFIP